MNSVQISLLAIAIGYGFHCCYRLYRNQIGGASALLTGFLTISTIGYIAEWLMLHPSTPFKSLWLWFTMSAALLLLPFFWYSVRVLLALPYARNHGVWLWPAVGMLLIVPLILDTHSGTDFYNPIAPTSVRKAFAIHVGMFVSAGIFATFAPCLLLRAKAASNALLSNITTQQKQLVDLLILALAVKWLCCFLRVIHCAIMGANPGFELNIVMTLDIVVTLWALSQIFKRLYQGNEPASSDNTINDRVKDDKYQSSGLNTPTSKRILQKLEYASKHEGLHRQSDLSLTKLSEHFRESPHYISQVLNQELGCNFYMWLNRQRIQDACELLAHNPDLKIIDIAELVGFNAKSTFNSAFYKHAGVTPSQYRNQQLQKGTNRTVRA